jgi:type IV pilus assembly protein PilA
MLRKLHERAQSEKGFTLIELLVVILIIGILAAIAIPSFINQRSKGQDAEAKAAAKTAAEAQETYFTDNQSYTLSTTALRTIEPTLNDANQLAINDGDGDSYQVEVTSRSNQGGGWYRITRAANGQTTRTCQTAGQGGCRAADANGNMW